MDIASSVCSVVIGACATVALIHTLGLGNRLDKTDSEVQQLKDEVDKVANRNRGGR